MLSADQFIELLLQRASDWTSLAVADDAEVNLAQRHDFGGSAANEDFIGNIKLVARNRLLGHGIAQIAGEGNQAVARDALENSRTRRCID